MSIDVSKIKPGDTVRARIEAEFSGTVSDDGTIDPGNNRIRILENTVTILEHVPARPDWADAHVLRIQLIGHERLVLAHGEGRFTDDHGHDWTTDQLSGLLKSPEVVLDGDGNPPTPEPEPRLHSEDADVAWAHYRKTYAPNPSHMAAAHKAFHAGWDMATTELQWDSTPEPEWLDADQLDDLPGLTVAIRRDGTEPRWRDETGEWCLLGHNGLHGETSDEFAPARVLWTPEDNR